MPGNGRKGAQGKKRLAWKGKNVREESSEKKGIEERQGLELAFLFLYKFIGRNNFYKYKIASLNLSVHFIFLLMDNIISSVSSFSSLILGHSFSGLNPGNSYPVCSWKLLFRSLSRDVFFRSHSGELLFQSDFRTLLFLSHSRALLSQSHSRVGLILGWVSFPGTALIMYILLWTERGRRGMWSQGAEARGWRQVHDLRHRGCPTLVSFKNFLT